MRLRIEKGLSELSEYNIRFFRQSRPYECPATSTSEMVFKGTVL
jgi:hypothetical protein